MPLLGRIPSRCCYCFPAPGIDVELPPDLPALGILLGRRDKYCTVEVVKLSLTSADGAYHLQPRQDAIHVVYVPARQTLQYLAFDLPRRNLFLLSCDVANWLYFWLKFILTNPALSLLCFSVVVAISFPDDVVHRERFQVADERVGCRSFPHGFLLALLDGPVE